MVQEEEKETNKFMDKVSTFEGCYHTVYDLHQEMDRNMYYTDQTGRFPVSSYCGMQYDMVLYETVSNSILVEALRNRTSGEMVAAYQ